MTRLPIDDSSRATRVELLHRVKKRIALAANERLFEEGGDGDVHIGMLFHILDDEIGKAAADEGGADA